MVIHIQYNIYMYCYMYTILLLYIKQSSAHYEWTDLSMDEIRGASADTAGK